MRPTWLLALTAFAAVAGATEKDALRIASFSPAATRILVDLGAAQELVAVTRWCEIPKGMNVPTTCDAFEPDVEALRRSGANLAILPRLANPMLEQRIRSVGLRTLVLSPESPDSPAADIARLAELTGRPEAGERLLEARRTCRRAATGRRVLIIWDGVCAGPSSYLAWAIRAAGAEPAPREGAWPEWDIEAAAGMQPELVIILSATAPTTPCQDTDSLARWRQAPGLRLTSAARSGHIYRVKAGSEWLPASGLPKAAEIIAGVLGK